LAEICDVNHKSASRTALSNDFEFITDMLCPQHRQINAPGLSSIIDYGLILDGELPFGQSGR